MWEYTADGLEGSTHNNGRLQICCPDRTTTVDIIVIVYIIDIGRGFMFFLSIENRQYLGVQLSDPLRLHPRRSQGNPEIR